MLHSSNSCVWLVLSTFQTLVFKHAFNFHNGLSCMKFRNFRHRVKPLYVVNVVEETELIPIFWIMVLRPKIFTKMATVLCRYCFLWEISRPTKLLYYLVTLLLWNFSCRNIHSHSFLTVFVFLHGNCTVNLAICKDGSTLIVKGWWSAILFSLTMKELNEGILQNMRENSAVDQHCFCSLLLTPEWMICPAWSKPMTLWRLVAWLHLLSLLLFLHGHVSRN